MQFTQDTIAAIATALGESSVGIVRVSGPAARDIVAKTFRLPSWKQINISNRRNFYYGYIVHPQSGAQLDECILLWMPGPRSYTAEDVVEYQVHGGIRVLQSVLEAVLVAGSRMAEPGEFTKRAFLNGRIDLSQAEAVIDLIRSKTDLASRAALNQVKGRMSEQIRTLRKQLIALQAHVEVTIDYPEHDVEDVAKQAVIDTGTSLIAEIDTLIAQARFGQILREGVQTTIAGRPNVGKSSLLNALLRRERAIVTEIPGTTRDILEEYVNIRGIPFKIVDTAGIRETVDVVERIGVEKSREMVETAALLLLVFDASESLTVDDMELLNKTSGAPRIVVLNKTDVGNAIDVSGLSGVVGDSYVVHISAKHLEGLGALEDAMESVMTAGTVSVAEASYMTTTRQSVLLQEARADLGIGVEAAEAGATLDIVAVQLQSAYAALGQVIGEEAGEDLLDEIFSRFCLGK